MTVEVKVPVFPESVNDGIIVNWNKKAGDPVERDEIIADIETDKVVFEIPAPSNGVILEVLQAEGATVVSEQVIAKIDETAIAESPVPDATK
ncbi:MAG: dihydrolipoamide succinyltransferase, partial [Gammaproteobacteria bacterium]|nr:dihydrolipoamide succinyltransferase [Gammaproteobacteria bacterium]